MKIPATNGCSLKAGRTEWNRRLEQIPQKFGADYLSIWCKDRPDEHVSANMLPTDSFQCAENNGSSPHSLDCIVLPETAISLFLLPHKFSEICARSFALVDALVHGTVKQIGSLERRIARVLGVTEITIVTKWVGGRGGGLGRFFDPQR